MLLGELLGEFVTSSVGDCEGEPLEYFDGTELEILSGDEDGLELGLPSSGSSSQSVALLSFDLPPLPPFPFPPFPLVSHFFNVLRVFFISLFSIAFISEIALSRFIDAFAKVNDRILLESKLIERRKIRR